MFDEQLTSRLRTARDYVRWGASRMNEAGLCFGHGSSEAEDDAAALVLHALHLPPDIHPDYLDCALSSEEAKSVLDLFSRRIEQRVPCAYLTNEAWFAGRCYFLDERVLVPRSPIAELVTECFYPWIDPPAQARRILDLCTGSGCIGIACAHAFPRAQVDLSDISEEALEVAELNVVEHEVQERVAVIHSDLFQGLGGQRYDLIVSNPPYVASDEMEELPDEYLHEPELGLVGGTDGLKLVAHILRHAAVHLTEEGLLIVEVGASWRQALQRWPKMPFVWLKFQRGGEGVFLLTRRQLERHRWAV
jgi:ribosomal protein L3 glutamine methyltransferase